MRIVAGKWRGRRLHAPSGQRVRPTADQVREALFSILFDVEGAKVLDLYAGTGAIGLEAVSRGAASALLVERNRFALAALERNVKDLGATPAEIDVRSQDVRRAIPALEAEGRRFDLIFADPPYTDAAELLAPVLEAAPRLLEAAGRLVLEHELGFEPPEPPAGLSSKSVRRYGETVLRFYERPGEQPEEGA